MDFDLHSGYAHVIEDEANYDPRFPYEIIGGALRIEKSKILYPKEFDKESWKGVKNSFLGFWQKYDWA